jgi:very-short-patch-repair endonuclease/superfamily I DNA/RNA helicase
VRELSDQPKVVSLSDLPQHPSVQLVRPVRVQDGQEIPDLLLRVKRPTLTRCPQPPEIVEAWLLPGWDDPSKPATYAESQNAVDKDGNTVTVRFEDDDERITTFLSWDELRQAWAPPEVLTRRALRFFELFYDIHSMLEKENEQLELLVADGQLAWRTTSSIDGLVTINHPVLLKRVELRFDPNVPEFTVHETDREPEIYGALFVDLKEVAPSALRNRQNELASSGYHPIGWEDTDAFLKAFVQTVSPVSGEFFDEPSPAITETPRMWRTPVLLLRKRVAGIANAIDAIVDDIEHREVFPSALAQITGTADSWNISALSSDGSGSSSEALPRSGTVPAISDDEILLAKETNEEQLQIIRRLSHSGSVIVQGPPGTGKTHTIGNLIGHLLAQGKSILVTAHTTKALRVLRDKVPDVLQPLCVAVLGSDQEGRRQLESSIGSITERLTKDSSANLLARAQQHTQERKQLLHKSRELEKLLMLALENEYREIAVGDKTFSPSDAARYVASQRGTHDWIPTPVKLGAALNLTEQELLRLYTLSTLFTAEEERDAAYPLPELAHLPSERQFQVMVSEYHDLLTKDLSFGQNRWQNTTRSSAAIEELASLLAAEFSDDLRSLAWRPYAITAGIHGGTERQVWERLISKIEEACDANARHGLLMHHRPRLSEALPVVQQRQITIEICEHLDLGGKLGFLQLVTRTGWRKFIGTASVAAGRPNHRDHFEALAHAAHLETARVEIEDLWNELIGQRANASFDTLGPTPELSCRALIPEIRRCLEWHSAVWLPLVDRIKAEGLKLDDLAASLPREPSQIAEYLVVERMAVTLLSPLFEAEAARRKLKECETNFDGLAELSTRVDPSAPNRGCVGKILAAVRARSADAYATALEYARRLHTVRPLISDREALLQKLRPVAPGWAERISLRSPPHNTGELPANIPSAWLWRQLHDTLAERDRLDAQEIQRQIDKTRQIVQQLTQWLIDAQAWGKQLDRLQGNNSVRQALVGWLDTAKRLASTRQFDKRQMLLSEARKLMKQCAPAVPAWIMPISVMAESFDPRTTRFDVVIIDEASQADLNALIPLYMAKQIVVVGDHEQVTPLGVGRDQTILDNLRKSILQDIPNAHLFDNMSSIYDIGRQSFGDAIRLVEHFRCVPEIIAFSNQLSYDGKIRPLRESNSTALRPACIPYRIDGLREGDINLAEAETIVSLIKAMIKHPAYTDKTIGVISMLGENQAVQIQTMLHKQIEGVDLQKRRIQAGISGQFQGDERDVIFLSMVDSPEAEGFLRAVGEGAFEQTKKRYNVAASRARDQLWVIHTFDPDRHLKANDIRLRLLQHVKDPWSTVRAYESEAGKTESDFERQVLKRLTNAGYRVRTQWQVGYYRIDLVVEGGNKRLAIECDGDRYHPLEKLVDDIARQTVLERLGWHFIRLRGSAFYRDADAAMKPVFERLMEMEIPPDGDSKEDASTDWTLVNELEMLAREADEIIEEADAETSSETQEIFPDEPAGTGPEAAAFVQSDTIFQGTADATIEQLLNELGGQSSIERFLRHFAKARGFQRLGKNIRKSLNRELNRLKRRGKITLDDGLIKLL